jgi:transposase
VNLIEMKPYMAKSVLDASWSRFRTYVTYKAASAGRRMVLVNPAYTSLNCSGCGAIVKKDLSLYNPNNVGSASKMSGTEALRK